MKPFAVLAVLFASLALASPLEPRGSKDVIVDDEGAGGRPMMTIDEDDEPPVYDNKTLTTRDVEADGDDGADLPTGDVVPLGTRGLAKRDYSRFTWQHTYSFKISFKANDVVEFFSSGNVRFYTYFRNEGWWTYKYGISCAVSDAAGRVYTLSRTGTVYGKTAFWKSRTTAVDETRYNNNVKVFWNDISNGNRYMYCKVNLASAITWDTIADMLEKLFDILKKYGPIAATVIALF